MNEADPIGGGDPADGLTEAGPWNVRLTDVFVAQAQRPPGLSSVDLSTLSPFLRALILADGTVTRYLEAFAWEPVEVMRLGQDRYPLADDHRWLEAPAGTEVIGREVILRGRATKRLRARAVSLIVPSRLPERIVEELSREGGSVGRVLLTSRLETFRELLWYGREEQDGLPETIAGMMDDPFVTRAYRVFANRVPTMFIQESYPSPATMG